MADLSSINKDFNACNSLNDYENFVIKYNNVAPDNQLVVNAKSKIAELSNRQSRCKFTFNPNVKNGELHPIIVIVLCLAAIVVAILLFKVSMSYDGASVNSVYHGEHGDYKTTNWETMIGGPGCLFGSLILGGAGIFYLFMSIMKLTGKK